MNEHSLEKLCGVAAAAGIIGVGTALATPVAAGVVEAVIGSTGVLLGIRSEHRSDFRRVLESIRNRVENEYRDWIRKQHGQESWYVIVNIENALGELDGVIDKCVPTPQEVARAGVKGLQLANLMLEKAAIANPGVYAPGGGNPAAREILSTIVAQTFELVRDHPDYAARLRTYIDEEQLQQLSEIRQQTGRIEGKVDVILAAMGADKGVPLPVLQEILAQLGDPDVPLDAVMIEQRLRAKADKYAALFRLSSEDPRVPALQRRAADLISQGGFTAAIALPYDNIRRALEHQGCSPRGLHPSSWWHHPIVGDFWIDIIGGEVSETQFSLIMSDIIGYRPGS